MACLLVYPMVEPGKAGTCEQDSSLLPFTGLLIRFGLLITVMLCSGSGPAHAAPAATSVVASVATSLATSATAKRVPAKATIPPVNKRSGQSEPTPGPSDPTDPMNAFRIPKQTHQLIVGITNGWSGNTAQLRRFTRTSGGWRSADSEPFPAVLGPKGLAWGRGVHPIPEGASPKAAKAPLRTKREGDKRSPAGVFQLGSAYGYDAIWAARTKLKYVTVTAADLFVEDVGSEFYNRQIRLDRPASTDWELSQQMEQTDPAHRLEVVVEHNTPSPIPGAGSAILLHIWRAEGKKFTTGCTAMSDSSIESIVAWLDPKAHPLYVLLPRSEYLARQDAWELPPLLGT